MGLAAERWRTRWARSLPGGASAGGSAAFSGGSRIAGYRLEKEIGARRGPWPSSSAPVTTAARPAGGAEDPGPGADGQRRSSGAGSSSESRAAAAVDDPHIIPVYEAGEAQGVLFISMRYVSGGDVRTLLRREGPLAPTRAAAIVSPMASALDAAHAAGLVHRDVKPANMLMDARLPGRPDPRLPSGFRAEQGPDRPPGGDDARTAPGDPVAYMAPEQIEEPGGGRAERTSTRWPARRTSYAGRGGAVRS